MLQGSPPHSSSRRRQLILHMVAGTILMSLSSVASVDHPKPASLIHVYLSEDGEDNIIEVRYAVLEESADISIALRDLSLPSGSDPLMRRSHEGRPRGNYSEIFRIPKGPVASMTALSYEMHFHASGSHLDSKNYQAVPFYILAGTNRLALSPSPVFSLE